VRRRDGPARQACRRPVTSARPLAARNVGIPLPETSAAEPRTTASITELPRRIRRRNASVIYLTSAQA
jgi:hypothetical protein